MGWYPNAKHLHSPSKWYSKRGTKTIIFTDWKVRIIGDAELTGVDTIGDQELPQTQLLDDTEVTPHIEVTPPEAIPDIDLATNHNNEATTPEDTPNTLEPPQLLKSLGTTGDIPFQSSPTTHNIFQPKHDILGVHRSTRVRTHTNSYSLSLSGNKYSYELTKMENMGIVHPEAHMLFNLGNNKTWPRRCRIHHDVDVTQVSP